MISKKTNESEVLTRPAKIRQNHDPTRPDPRVHPTRGQLWYSPYYTSIYYGQRIRRYYASPPRPAVWRDPIARTHLPTEHRAIRYICAVGNGRAALQELACCYQLQLPENYCIHCV